MLTVSPLLVQAVNIGGRSYDVCVKLWGSGRVLLLVENFDDVKAPGLLAHAAQAAAGCPGCLEDEEEGIYWSLTHPLEKKGCYIFFPREPPGSEPCSSLTWRNLMGLHPPLAPILHRICLGCLPYIGLIAVEVGL